MQTKANDTGSGGVYLPENGLKPAVRQAIVEAMEADGNVVVFGEDVAEYGGAYKVTEGLLDLFGERRVKNTPISEIAIVGAAVGAAAAGLRPVIEIQFCDFLTCAMDQICNQAAKLHMMSGGAMRAPLTIRTPIGSTGRGAQHSQCLEAWFMHTPGLKVAIPSSAYDAKGLMAAAIADENPVLFFEHKLLYTMKHAGKGEFEPIRPALMEPYSLPFGVAEVKREGRDVSIVATAYMVHQSLRAAQMLQEEGISAEVVDPRTLVPLDGETILRSVRKTGRLIAVSEDSLACGVSAEIAAVVAENAPDALLAPVRRLCVPDTPIPFAPNNEKSVIPDAQSIAQAAREIVST